MSVETLTQLADPRLDPFRELNDAERSHDGFIAEGRRLIRELLSAERFYARRILCTETAYAKLEPDLKVGDVDVLIVDRVMLDEVAGLRFHQGCLAWGVARTDGRPAEVPRGNRLLILESVVNPDNVGAVFRNAWAFDVSQVWLSPGCASPLYRKALRASMGGVFHVPFVEIEHWPDALELLANQGFTRLALTPGAGAEDLRTFVVPERWGLCVGSEHPGLSDACLAHVDRRVRIPHLPSVDSLNLATATGIALHHLVATS